MSITLPADLQSALTIGGINVETDNFAAVTVVDVNYQTKILTMTVQQGTTTGQVFAPGQYPPSYVFVINMVTGVWYINGTNLGGTFTGPSIAAISALFLPLRNSGEQFVLQVNLFPSATAVAWTQI
jgi:hypothetical protein